MRMNVANVAWWEMKCFEVIALIRNGYFIYYWQSCADLLPFVDVLL